MKLSKEQQKYKDALKRVCQLCHTRAWRLVCVTTIMIQN